MKLNKIVLVTLSTIMTSSVYAQMVPTGLTFPNVPAINPSAFSNVQSAQAQALRNVQNQTQNPSGAASGSNNGATTDNGANANGDGGAYKLDPGTVVNPTTNAAAQTAAQVAAQKASQDQAQLDKINKFLGKSTDWVPSLSPYKETDILSTKAQNGQYQGDSFTFYNRSVENNPQGIVDLKGYNYNQDLLYYVHTLRSIGYSDQRIFLEFQRLDELKFRDWVKKRTDGAALRNDTNYLDIK